MGQTKNFFYKINSELKSFGHDLDCPIMTNACWWDEIDCNRTSKKEILRTLISHKSINILSPSRKKSKNIKMYRNILKFGKRYMPNAIFGISCIYAIRSVFFNLYMFTAPCKTKKKFGGTLTWLKWQFGGPKN